MIIVILDYEQGKIYKHVVAEDILESLFDNDYEEYLETHVGIDLTNSEWIAIDSNELIIEEI
jgi:hypothetical protein